MSNSETKTILNTLSHRINDLFDLRESWERNELARSNAKLYEILTGVYELWAEVRGKPSVIAQIDKALAGKNIRSQSNTHLVAKLIKLVFGPERRRTNAYATALRRAFKEEVKAENLGDWITEMGGVEEIRLSAAKPNAETPQQKRARLRNLAVNEIVTAPEIAKLPKQKDLPKTDDDFVLCVGVAQSDGTVKIVKFVDQSLVPLALEKLGKAIEKVGQTEAAKAAEQQAEAELQSAFEEAMAA